MPGLLHQKVAAIVNSLGRYQMREVPMLGSVMLFRFSLLETRISGKLDEIITARV
jgi:hypothetical protein